MDLEIKGIRYENIREFKELDIDLKKDNGDPHHISLIQMPNGTGKTTTMQLIRMLLLGQELDEETVRSFEPNDFDAIDGSFEVDFESPSDQFTLRLELDYETGGHNYRHISPKEVGGGDTAGHFLPGRLDTVINEDFVDLFVFNGELTQDFIETGRSEAENALKIVNYLNRLEVQRNLIDEEVEKKQPKDGVTSEKGYRNVKGRLDTAKKKLKELEKREEALDKQIDEHESKIEELESDRRNILAKNEEQLEKDKRLESDIQELRSEIEKSTNQLLDEMRQPSKLNKDFHNDMENLLNNMDIMELPKPTSREFFTELSKRPKCICGRDIEEEHAEKILNNAEKYLSEEDIGVLNILKENLRNIPDFDDLEDDFDDLEEKREKLEGKKQEKARVGADLDDPDLNERLEEIIENIEDHESKLEKKERELRKLKSTDKNEREELGLDWRNNIHLCRQKVDERTQEVREASNTVNFGKKADILKEIFDEFIDEYLKTLKQNQIDETNHRLEQILGLSEVQIEDIDNSIVIKGRDDIS